MKVLSLFFLFFACFSEHSAQVSESFKRFRGNHLIYADGTPVAMQHDLHLDSIDIIFSETVTEKEVNPQGIRVFPNPTSGSLGLYSVADDMITLSDLSGRVLLKRKIKAGNNLIDISHLRDGEFLLRSCSQSACFSPRLIIKRH